MHLNNSCPINIYTACKGWPAHAILIRMATHNPNAPRQGAGKHGSPMLSVTYREVKSRLSELLLKKLVDYCAESGLSQSEVIRQALELFLGMPPVDRMLPNEPNGFSGPDDPSNPLA